MVLFFFFFHRGDKWRLFQGETEKTLNINLLHHLHYMITRRCSTPDTVAVFVEKCELHAKPSYEVQFSEQQGLKVDMETHIVLPRCSTKRGTLDELLKEEGHGIRF